MSAAMITAIAALLGSPLVAVAAMYGSRGANRATREGGALTGYNSLTDQLQEERQELRTDLTTARAELATERLESARLRLLVQQLGGQP
jgi:ABC-type transport system involved in cytochrome c biogenesis permease subunit